MSTLLATLRVVFGVVLGVALAVATSAACDSRGPSPQDPAPVPEVATVGKITAPANAPASVPPSASAPPACTGQTPLVSGVPGSPGHLIPSPINPNGQSELADLMRLMLADMKAARDTVSAGVATTLGASHPKIRCAWPTDPADHTDRFDAMAVAHIGAVEAFNSHPIPTVDHYNAVVQTCVACHKQTCGGPLVVIRPLRISKAGEAPAATPELEACDH